MSVDPGSRPKGTRVVDVDIDGDSEVDAAVDLHTGAVDGHGDGVADDIDVPGFDSAVRPAGSAHA
jgi:hypothetical protein